MSPKIIPFIDLFSVESTLSASPISVMIRYLTLLIPLICCHLAPCIGQSITLKRADSDRSKDLQCERVLAVKTKNKIWQTDSCKVSNDNLVIWSYVTDSIPSNFDSSFSDFVFRDTSMVVPIDQLQEIHYSKVKNWDKKARLYGGFGLGYSLALALTGSTLGALVSVILGNNEEAKDMGKIALASYTVMVWEIWRLRPKKYIMGNKWNIGQLH